MMQLNLPAFAFRLNNDDLDETQASEKDQVKPEYTDEQKLMVERLRVKKDMVINRLINGLSHSNRGNIEVSLNSCTVLIELIEIEKSFELFFQDDCRFIRRLIELATDPSNEFNQKYLLQILLQLCKCLKPQQHNIFKDMDDDDQESKKLDPQSSVGKMVLKFLQLV
jgi:hypothetical protein